jgi:hypothetical protein
MAVMMFVKLFLLSFLLTQCLAWIPIGSANGTSATQDNIDRVVQLRGT